LVPEKRVEFCEPTLYRVLSIKAQTTYYTFEGIWDPGVPLRDTFLKTLKRKFNFNTIPLWQTLEPDAYRDLVQTAESSFNEARNETGPRAASFSYPFGLPAFGVEWTDKPPYNYLKTTVLGNIRSLKETAGIDFVLELHLAGISITRPHSLRVVAAYVYGRLVRLSDGAVLWLDKGFGSYSKAKFERFSDLEKNNLELLKECYEEAVIDLFDPNKPDFAGGPFLKGLIPR